MAITRVQSATGNVSGGTSFTVTFASSPTNGDFLACVIGSNSASANPVSSISQTGATWVKAVTVTNVDGESVDIWYAENVSGAGTIITVNLAASLNAFGTGLEYSGVKTSASVDQTASATGDQNTSMNSGTTAVTFQRNELWLAGLMVVSGSGSWGTPSNGFANVATTFSPIIYACEEKIVSVTGVANTSNQPSVLTNPCHWAGAIATFKDVNPGRRVMVIS